MEQKEYFHGSDLEKIQQKYGIKKEDVIRFSANVNPLGISYRLRDELASHIDAISQYPDREYTSLRNTIADYTDTRPDDILVGNGSTDLISLIIQQLHSKNALIIGPTYSEYEHEITLCGGHATYFPLQESKNFALEKEALYAALTPDIDLLVLCNPNNPTSSQIEQNVIQEIADCCSENHIFIMIDETYVEFTECYDKITSVPLVKANKNLIVIRGVSKFFAAPGLRLGYAVCSNEALLKRIRDCQKPWTINSLAAIAGKIMFNDKQYIQKTTQLISSERKRICSILDAHKDIFQYYPPHANFILLRSLREEMSSEILFQKAIQKGMMIRDCSSFPFLNNRYIRFCFMQKKDNDALLSVLLDKTEA